MGVGPLTPGATGHSPSAKPVGAKNVEGAQKWIPGVGATPSGPVEDLTGTQAAQQTAPGKAAEALPDISKPLNMSDIKQTLLGLGQPITAENQQILLMLVEHGVAATSENFETISKLMKGRTHAKSLESAVVSLAKGLSEMPKTVDLLSSFFGGQSQLKGLVQNAQHSVSQFFATLQSSQQLMAQGLFAGLSGVLGDLDDNMKKLLKRNQLDSAHLLNMGKGGLLQDVKSLHAFLGGLAEQIRQGQGDAKQVQGFLQQLAAVRGHLKDMIEHFAMMGILSKDGVDAVVRENFTYWQIPNLMAQVQTPIELLVKKQVNKEKSVADGGKFILKLETPELGEVAVTLEFKGQKLYSLFQTELVQTQDLIQEHIGDFKESMAAQNYDLAGFKVLRQRVDLKKMMIPTTNLDDLSRVRAEV